MSGSRSSFSILSLDGKGWGWDWGWRWDWSWGCGWGLSWDSDFTLNWGADAAEVCQVNFTLQMRMAPTRGLHGMLWSCVCSADRQVCVAGVCEAERLCSAVCIGH